MSNRFTQYILIAMVLGIVMGALIFNYLPDSRGDIAGAVNLVAMLFLRLIKMIIAPLVFATLVGGIAHMGSGAKLGRIFAKTMGWFVSASFVSLLLGLVMVYLHMPDFREQHVYPLDFVGLVLFGCGLTLVSLLLIIPLNRLTHELSVIAVLLAASYPYTKRFFPVPQAYLGIAFAFGIPMSFAATNGQVPMLAWVMTLATGFWVVAYDTAYAIADKPDDLKIGIKTSAITFGRHDVNATMLCHGVFLVLMVWLGRQWSMGLSYYTSIAISCILIIMQYHEIKERDRQRCFKAFLDNNRVGAVIFAGIVLDYLLR